MKVFAYITRVKTGEVRKYEDPWEETGQDPDHWFSYQWTDGNYGCDCNRRLFFHRAAGEREPAVVPCGTTRYRVKLVDAAYERVIFDENPTVMPKPGA